MIALLILIAPMTLMIRGRRMRERREERKRQAMPSPTLPHLSLRGDMEEEGEEEGGRQRREMRREERNVRVTSEERMMMPVEVIVRGGRVRLIGSRE